VLILRVTDLGPYLSTRGLVTGRGSNFLSGAQRTDTEDKLHCLRTLETHVARARPLPSLDCRGGVKTLIWWCFPDPGAQGSSCTCADF
jgi:hypothetical protein